MHPMTAPDGRSCVAPPNSIVIVDRIPGVVLRLFCCAVVPLLAAGNEATVRKLLQRKQGRVVLPAGVIEVRSEFRVAARASGLTVTGHPKGTVLRAGSKFDGKAIFVAENATGITFSNFTIDGNRTRIARATEIAPYDKTFASYYAKNGILAVNVRDLRIAGVEFREIANFAVIVSASRKVMIDGVRVVSSGSLNSKARNNTSGGILLEEATEDFTVRNSFFRSIRGNGVWTHSLYTSRRNARGVIAGNRFDNIGRDAIQIGHATQVRVERNTGARIGYPVHEVDVEGGGTPVAIDTAGNVDETVYVENQFEEINGKCVDLDGFHNGEVRSNICTNELGASDYPFGHYGIVFNNTNPDMQSKNIRVTDNVISGTKFGGIFIIGRNHTIARNTFRRVNLAGCNENAAKFGCLYDLAEPDLLQAGIYLGKKAERPDVAEDNIITDNTVSGHGMDKRCILAAAGVELSRQTIERNTCRNTTAAKP